MGHFSTLTESQQQLQQEQNVAAVTAQHQFLVQSAAENRLEVRSELSNVEQIKRNYEAAQQQLLEREQAVRDAIGQQIAEDVRTNQLQSQEEIDSLRQQVKEQINHATQLDTEKQSAQADAENTQNQAAALVQAAVFGKPQTQAQADENKRLANEAQRHVSAAEDARIRSMQQTHQALQEAEAKRHQAQLAAEEATRQAAEKKYQADAKQTKRVENESEKIFVSNFWKRRCRLFI